MRMGLTPRARDLLAFIEDYQGDSGGTSPSFVEMAAAVGSKSTSTVPRLLGQLEERGLIRRLERRARAIEILSATPTHCPHCGKRADDPPRLACAAAPAREAVR